MSHYSEVFKYMEYEDGPDVPVVLATQVGGIYRVGPGVIQATLINHMIRDEKRLAKAVVHQLWNEDAWLDSERLFRFTAEHLKEAIPRELLLKTAN